MSLLCAAFLMLQAALGQTAVGTDVPSTASIEGRVVRTGTSEPIAGVQVELIRVEGTARAPVSAQVTAAILTALAGAGPGGDAPPPLMAPEIQYTETDSAGQFAFRNVKEGKFRLAAAYTGGTYFPAEYGQHNVRGRGLFFPVAEGQALRDIRLEMAPTSAISGRVFGADGQPMAHVTVMALEPQYRQGQPRFYIERSVLTDEHGNYRLYWLAPGPHYVAAVFEDPQRRNRDLNERPPGRVNAYYRATAPFVSRQVLADGAIVEETFGVVYYGGVSDPASSPLIDLAPGQTAAAIDIAMEPGRRRAFHIRGNVINAAGEPARGAQVLAIPREWRPNAHILAATADDKGDFDLAGAVPDRYVITASTSSVNAGLAAAIAAAGLNISQVVAAGSAAESGYVAFEMGSSDASGLRIVTRGGIDVSGRVAIEGQPSAENDPNLARIAIGLTRESDLIAMPAALMPLPPLPRPAPGAPAPQRPANGQVTGDGAFNLLAAPGEFQVTVSNIPQNTYVKSIRMGSVDVMLDGLRLFAPPESSMEIVLGADVGSVRGRLTDDSQSAVPNAVVALVPDLPALRRIPSMHRSTTTDFAGTFELTGIAPGDYKLFAWRWAPADAWQNEEFLRNVDNAGTRVRVFSGGREEVRITVLPGR